MKFLSFILLLSTMTLVNLLMTRKNLISFIKTNTKDDINNKWNMVGLGSRASAATKHNI